MKAQYENLLISSFLLWLDNKILTNGQAYTNYSSKFYPIKQKFNGYYSYSAPFSQFVNDFSVSGANVPTGLYLNNFFVVKGQSGLVDINYEKGQAYFSSEVSSNVTISGNYSIKDFNILLPRSPDITVLFETKLNLRPKINQSFTGVADNEISYPAIFVRPEGGKNLPFAFGGLKDTKTNISLYVFADSQFNLDAINNILKDQLHEYVPFLNANELPFNNLGGFKNNINYNYTGIIVNKISNGSGVFVEDVNITDFTRRGLFSEVQSLTNDAYFSIVEFILSKPRLT